MIRKLKNLSGGLLVAVAALFWSASAQAQNIDTRADATLTYGNFGRAAFTPSWGQSFKVPAGSNGIASFSIRMFNVPSTANFQLYLMAWNPTTRLPTGPVLYQSAAMATTGATMQDVSSSLSTPVSVTPGGDYIAFATTVPTAGNPTSTGLGEISVALNSTYADGEFFYSTSTTEAGLTSVPWSTGNFDLGVTVAFTSPPPAPVPTLTEWAMILMGIILAGAALIMIERRRRLA